MMKKLLISTLLTLLSVSTSSCIKLPRPEAKNRTLEEYLLPTDISPLEYDIHIIPYLEIPEVKAFTFDSKIKIKFQVNNVTNMIRMHAYNMTVLGDAVIVQKFDGENLTVSHWNMSTDDKHFLSFYLNVPLNVNENYTVEFEYIGVLNDALDGFYRSSYNDSEFGKSWLAATQFSPNGARRAFPCWDEPRWKASFKLHIAHAPDYDVIANMPEESTSPVEGHPGLEDWTWVHLKPTPVMSTFIVGFTVSQFSALLNTEDFRFRAWARRDVVLQGTYANKMAPRLLGYMENYTQVNYPLTKMDQVAIPDFAANAMENWGMINYRETALLFEEGVSNTANRQRVATVIAHETAHQWFGNLVSPAWWGYVWLKEGFARYFEYFAMAAIEGGWQLDQQFVQLEMRSVFQTDAINTSHPLNSQVDSPSSIAANFDNIAYNKGGCIIRFMVNLMGEENFKIGINNYITELAHQNALPDDLWRLLQPSVPEGVLPEGSDLKKVMDTWTVQAGFPVVTVIREYLGNSSSGANLTQERFLALPNKKSTELWSIPVTFTSQADPKFTDLEVKAWLTEEELRMSELPASDDQWVIFNNMQIGYYRVNYDPRNWALLHAALNSPQLSDIHVINRAQLTDDALALARAGLLDYPTALDTTAYLAMETEYVPWSAALTALGYVGDRLAYETEHRELFQWYVLDKLQHMYELVGGLNVGSKDSHVLRLTRALVLEWTCAQGHMECRSKTTALFKQWQNDPEDANPIDPDLRNVVYCSGMRAGGDEEFSFLFGRYENASLLASEQTVILSALGCSSDTALLESYLQESIKEGSVIRPHDARSAITAVYNNYLGVDIALDFLLENFEQASKVYGGFGAIGKVFSGLSAKLNTQEHKNKLAKFRDDNLEGLGTALVSVEAAIVTVQESLSWHQLHRTTVLEYLGDKRGDSGASTLTIGGLLLMLTLAMTLA